MNIVRKHGTGDSDTGSTKVQVAKLTQRITFAQLLEMIDAARDHLTGIDKAAQRAEGGPDESQRAGQDRRHGGERRRGQGQQAFPEMEGAGKTDAETAEE